MAKPEADTLIRDPDCDEDDRFDEWRAVLRSISALPPVLQALLALDAWNGLAVLQCTPWLGRLLAASLLRRHGLTSHAQQLTFNTDLKTVRIERRRLIGPRASSNLPGLIELVLARPLMSTGLIAKELDITSRAALRLAEELILREMTGRGRFWAWGIA
ncbi:DUF1612 domain-containing protein [Brucella pseudogrignonensis]|uniref:DUF1612 domain-containing protein n=1 Tax=Brucella pseudogrignonensis TaxID=419475 RepID=UPI0028B3B62E|nr:DUF1612 domain-containing protein [Brucella pseudogrignonensis]MDT6942335.1 DUF1612 domain-containing protein [Brucella pseudogrignonensis]